MRSPLFFLIAALLIPACNRTDDSDVLATVGTAKIRTADLQAEIARRQSANRPVPPLPDLLTEMVEYETILQAAKSAGLESDPDIQRAHHNLLIGTLKDRQLRPLLDAAAVTDAEIEIETYYQNNKENYQRPARSRIAVIFVASSPQHSDNRRQQAQQRIEEARTLATTDPDGFKRAAAQFSDDQSTRYKAGDLGWLNHAAPHARIPQQVLEVATALEPGTVSEVIATDTGYYLAKPLAREPASYTPLDNVRTSIASKLLQQIRATITTGFHADLKTQAGVTTFPDRLDKIEIPASAANNGEPTPPQL